MEELVVSGIIEVTSIELVYHTFRYRRFYYLSTVIHTIVRGQVSALQ